LIESAGEFDSKVFEDRFTELQEIEMYKTKSDIAKKSSKSIVPKPAEEKEDFVSFTEFRTKEKKHKVETL
jgi:hypothetical protein